MIIKICNTFKVAPFFRRASLCALCYTGPAKPFALCHAGERQEPRAVQLSKWLCLFVLVWSVQPLTNSIRELSLSSVQNPCVL